MQSIDSGFCRTPGAAGEAGAMQGFKGLHGSAQDRADQLVRATVLSDLGGSTGHGRHRLGIQGIASAIRKVLSGQDVTGTDASDNVLSKIETSLHKAAQKLADRGIDAKTIDATIDRFRAQLAHALDGMAQGGGSGAGGGDGSSGTGGSISGTSASGTVGSTAGSATAPGAGTPAPATTSVSSFVTREVRKERGAIDLVTAEGDRVSIRFRTKEVVTGSVAQSTESDGSTTTGTKASMFSRAGVKIEVDGDLNEDELAAIGDLLGKVDDIANRFFSGDVQAAFSAAGSLGIDSDQIAAYRLNLTYSRKLTAAYGYAGTSLPTPTQPPATGDDPTTGAGASAGGSSPAASTSDSASTSGSPSSGSISTGGSTSAGGSGGASAASANSTSGEADGASTGGTAPNGTSDTPPATTPPASAQKTLLDFINDALSKLNSVNGAGRLSFSMHWKMNVLVTALESTQPAQPTTPADQTAANNTQLLSDSLQKIAAA